MVDISNVVNVTISAAEPSLGNYNTNAFLYLASESPVDAWDTEYRVYTNANDVETDFGTSAKVTAVARAMFAQNYNFLSGDGYLIIAPLQTTVVEETPVVESLSAALTRVSALIYFGGWASDKTADSSEIVSAAEKTETMDCIYILGTDDSEDLGSGELFDTLSDMNLDHTKLVYYSGNVDSFVGAYASRVFSVNFSAQNSTMTANLKTLKGFMADETVTQTLYTTLKTLGVDGYVDYGGVAKIVSNANGNNNYFDDVYNRLWFKQAMKVAIFNALASTNTKVPQTEQGMDYLKKAARGICQQAVYNGFLAAGTWNGQYLFGNPEDFARNIADFGYFIYSLPVSQQSQTDRLARKAPVIQIAGKQAGAIHSASIIVTFEA